MPVMKRLTVGGVNYDTVGEASVTQVQTSGTKIATVSIDGTSTDIYAPDGGGSTVEVTQTLSSGTEIASVSVDGTSTTLYAPTPPTVPSASSTTPSMDGTASAGTSTSYARADHVHPSDTSKLSGIGLDTPSDTYTVPVFAGYATIDIGDGLDVSDSGNKATISAKTGTTSGTVAAGNHTHSNYQATLVSGTNIKTINGDSILGSGDLTVGSSVEPSTTTPSMDGTAAVGTATTYARADHVHPIDTSRVPASVNSADGTVTGEVSNAGASVTLSVEGGNIQNLVSVKKSEIRLYASDTGDSMLRLVSDGSIVFSSDSVSFALVSDVTAPTPASGNSSNKVATTAFVATALSGKQATLVSGTNIKTVNGTSILGSGNIDTAELPSVTSSDDGKVLTVDNGAWTAATPSGGSTTSYTTATVTLTVAGWANDSQTVSASPVTTTNDVIVSPAPASAAAWASAGVLCTAQGAGTLTFTCATTPTDALTANVMVLSGGMSSASGEVF